MHTQPDGKKSPTAPQQWPFGTIKPPTKKQLQDDLLKQAPAAPF